eukprot:6098707-Amphidinium_carterae.1
MGAVCAQQAAKSSTEYPRKLVKLTNAVAGCIDLLFFPCAFGGSAGQAHVLGCNIEIPTSPQSAS